MSTRIFLYFTNRNAYPVRIKNVKCFKKVTFQVLQKNDYRPEKTQRLDYDDLVFQTPQEYEIEAFADCSVVVNLDYPVQMDLEQLVCSTQTSHGYHLLKVKNIDVVRMGTPCASYLVPFEKTFESSFRAMIYHILTVTRYYILKSFKK
ncbi:hypothetical protein SAMN02745132_04402 [Enterovibrio nigricans DSM 22720]|uniref:Uncharacterized protein n=2 Tax=Enterovibrio nigricans TaxID=504469 RepID=A0A1T4VW11_9GAMM|nr:hypothetical protein SAMN02745132_04402 [Enterovibrio nigricans DSM 22720]